VQPNAWVVVGPATGNERIVPLAGRLLVGRECAGVEPSRRLILDNPAISRDHVELRSEPGRGAHLVDMSTNGTWLNGRRVERGEAIPLRDGDRIELGGQELLFRLRKPDEALIDEDRMTMLDVRVVPMAIVVGDVVGYTAMTELHGGGEVAALSDELFAALQRLLPEHGGTVMNYVGDAILAAWDMARDPEAARHAVTFALAGSELVAERAESLPLRDANGDPLRMGWAVTLGESASGRPSPTRQTVHGDAVNLAFRLAGLAAREGRAAVLVTADAAAAAPGAARYGESHDLHVKGRTAPAHVVSAAPLAPDA
jgi:class 3 adenylate cyclase